MVEPMKHKSHALFMYEKKMQEPIIKAKIFCKGCVYYQEQDGFADMMRRAFGREPKWNYKVCYSLCYKKLDEKDII